MPEGGNLCCKTPSEEIEVYRLDILVFIDVSWVIPGYKAVLQGREIDNEGCKSDKGGCDPDKFFVTI